MKRGNVDPDRDTPREDDVTRQEEDSHLQAPERGLEQRLSPWLSEGTSHAGTLMSGFWPPEPGENRILFQKP